MQPLAARVGGVDIPNQKKVEFSLQYIYGIGPVLAKDILSQTVRCITSTCCCCWAANTETHAMQGIENKRTRELTEEELTSLRQSVSSACGLS